MNHFQSEKLTLQLYGFYAAIYSQVVHLSRVTSAACPGMVLCTSEDGVVRLITSLAANTYSIIYPQPTLQVGYTEICVGILLKTYHAFVHPHERTRAPTCVHAWIPSNVVLFF